MEPRTLEYLAAATNGELRAAPRATEIRRVTTDSRELRPGDFFVAVAGERFNGHDFVAEAIQRGATAAMVARREAHRFPDLPLLIVADTRQGLGRIAARYRADYPLPVVAVAGSNGKTTTKELIASILGRCFETLRSPESFNNDIGVPTTLLQLETRHLAAVIEVGTNHPGELAPLVRMTQPRVGVLTHIGEEHLEFFGSLSGVIEEEGWLADLLPPDGVLILPGDPPWSRNIVARTRARVVRIGTGSDSDWRLLETETDNQGSIFSVRAPRPELSGHYRINLLGRHQVFNALLALATAAEFGLHREELEVGLARCTPPKWRMNRWQFEGVEVIEDCYNANLDSMLAALDTLRAFPCTGRRVAVIGGMAEQGTHTARAHETVGRRAAALALDRLIGIGDPASLTVEAATEAGMKHALAVDSLDTAAAALRAFLRPGDCLLVKGSRSAHLERLGPLLREAQDLQHAA